jgi:hypothetical protein
MGGPVLTWNAEDYACVAGSAGGTLVLDEGGFERQADLVLIVDRNRFTDGLLPKEQQTLVYQARTYRIAKVTLDAMGALVKLACVYKARGV